MAARLMSQERRKTPRIDERLSIAISEDGRIAQAQTQNLSTAGAYCTLDRFIAPMTKLQLVFELPDGNRRVRITCSGVVVRIEPVVTDAQRGSYQLAIYFSEMSDRSRIAISKFVRQRLAARPSTS